MVPIRSRDDWEARPARSRSTTTWGARSGFTVHYSAGPRSQTVRQIQDFHLDGRGWADVAYNFLVKDGVVYEGRGWMVVGAHAAPHNTSHIGVCVIGSDGDATAADKAAVRALYDEANRRAGRTLARTHHGGLSSNSTECPGADLRSWVQAGMPADDGATPGEMGTNHMLGLRQGDSGQAVRDLQVFLRDAGRPPANSMHDGEWDGDYGPGTAAAVLAVRMDNGASDAATGDHVSYWAMNQLRRGWLRHQMKGLS